MLMGIRKTERATEDDRSFRCVVAAVEEGRIIEPRPSGMVNADDDGDVLERANVARRVGRSWRTMVSNRNEERKKCCGRACVCWQVSSPPAKTNCHPGELSPFHSFIPRPLECPGKSNLSSVCLLCFSVFLTADLIFANLAFFLLLCPGKIKSVICLSAQLSSFFRQDPREIQFPSHQVSSEMTTKMSSLLLCPAITNTPFTPTALALLPPHHSRVG